MTDFVDRPVTVRVPATSANLGPGFDALGLALDRYDELTAAVAPTGLHIEVDGHDPGVPRDESHLVVRAMRATFARLGGNPPGLRLTCRNLIPHSRGLGSSAAAIVAGIGLARALVVGGTERLDGIDALALADELEGHPDNVAACLLGGATIAWREDGRARAVRLEPHADIRPVVFVPPFEASTAAARGLLPATVPHADAAFAAGRSALLIAALTGATEVLLPASDDRLHQPYRAPAMPQSAELVGRLRADGHAAVISGAGPTVLALARSEVEAEALMLAGPPEWETAAVAVARIGLHVVAG